MKRARIGKAGRSAMPALPQRVLHIARRDSCPVRAVDELDHQKLISLGPQIVRKNSKNDRFQPSTANGIQGTGASKNRQYKHLSRSSKLNQRVPETNF